MKFVSIHKKGEESFLGQTKKKYIAKWNVWWDLSKNGIPLLTFRHGRAGICQMMNCPALSLAFGRKWLVSVFEIRIFHLAGYFSWKAHEPLNLNKEIQKSAMGLGVTVTYACSVDCLFCNSNHMKSLSYEIFSWCLWQISFPIYFLFFTKICLISPSKKYPPCWSFKTPESNQFKVDIKSRTGLTWNADM